MHLPATGPFASARKTSVQVERRVKATRVPGQRCPKTWGWSICFTEQQTLSCVLLRAVLCAEWIASRCKEHGEAARPRISEFINNVFLNSDHQEHVLCELKLETLCPFPIWNEFQSPVKIPQTASYKGKLFYSVIVLGVVIHCTRCCHSHPSSRNRIIHLQMKFPVRFLYDFQFWPWFFDIFFLWSAFAGGGYAALSLYWMWINLEILQNYLSQRGWLEKSQGKLFSLMHRLNRQGYFRFSGNFIQAHDSQPSLTEGHSHKLNV